MKKNWKTLCLLLTLAMTIGLLGGCGQAASSQSSAEPTSSAETATETDTPEPSEAAPVQEISAESSEDSEIMPTEAFFPLDEAETISYWVQLNPEASSLISNYADTPGYEYLAQRLNVNFDFTCVSSVAASEAFSLMVASQDYCDILDGIVNVMGGGYPGGPAKAHEDGVIIDLTEYVEQYCPNYLTMLTDSGQLSNAKTDSGEILVFYPINTEFMTLTGVTVRNDYLKALNMDVPVTYDDYEEYARAVKSAYQISDPIYLSSDTNSWVMGYNVTGFAASSDSTGVDHIFQRDGVVTSAFLEDDYKEYLQRMHAWYEEGLISPAFYERTANIKSPEMESIILNGQVGIYPNDANSIQNHESMSSVLDMELVGAGWPRLTEDEVVHVSNSLDKLQQMGAVCISTDCVNFELVFRFMDWFYSEEAMMLAAFGVPDLYTVDADGNVEYTEAAEEEFENNQWGTTVNNAKGFYRAGIAGLKTQKDQFINWGQDSRETEAVYVWNDEHYDDAWLIPSTLSLTTEESQIVAETSSDIITYAAETIPGYITGDRSFDQWDEMVQKLQDMGLQKILDQYQAAVNRYQER